MSPAEPTILVHARRWGASSPLPLHVPQSPTIPILPKLSAIQEQLGEHAWILSFHHGSPTEVRFCDRHQTTGDAHRQAPWASPSWRAATKAWISEAVGPHQLIQHRTWGRSIVLRVEADTETFWFKESYGLPPGEGVALSLAARSSLCVPEAIAADGHRVLMRPLRGVPLRDTPPETWAAAITELVRFQQRADPDVWARAGCRDLRTTDWHAQISALHEEYGLPNDAAGALAERFSALGGLPAVVLPQDLGPCNLRWLGDRVQAFDWSDVVIGPPGMLLDRFYNECQDAANKDAVTEAWLAAWGPEATEAWAATRRCALLIEVLRFHSELAWLDADSPLAVRLRDLVGNQLRRQLDSLAR